MIRKTILHYKIHTTKVIPIGKKLRKKDGPPKIRRAGGQVGEGGICRVLTKCKESHL